MSRKHNTKHNRSKSNYPQRLKKRGLTNVDVRLTSLAQLRRNARQRGEVVNDDVIPTS